MPSVGRVRKAQVSFIERLQGHLSTDQAAGGAASRQEVGTGRCPFSLPVLEELLEDGTLAALGQNLHLQGQQETSLAHEVAGEGRSHGGGCYVPGLSPHALQAQGAPPGKPRDEKDDGHTG